MGCAAPVRTTLLLGLCSLCRSLPARSSDSTQSLVQRAVAIHPGKHVDEAKKALREVELGTKKQLHQQFTTLIKRVPSFPPLLVGSAKDLIVPKIMDLRRKSDVATRTLMDGLISINLVEKNFSDVSGLPTTLQQLSDVFGKAGHGGASLALQNASVLLPPLLTTVPKLKALDVAARAELATKLPPIFKAFDKDIDPHMKSLGQQVRQVVNRTLSEVGPHVQALMPQVLAVINGTLFDMLSQLRVGSDFADLRRALETFSQEHL